MKLSEESEVSVTEQQKKHIQEFEELKTGMKSYLKSLPKNELVRLVLQQVDLLMQQREEIKRLGQENE